MIANTPRVAMVAIVVAVTIATTSCGNTGDQWSAATLLHSDLGAIPCGGDVTMDAHGNAVAVWCRTTADYKSSVWANRFTLGEGWGTATRIDAENGTEVSQPSVAMNAAGHAMAVWSKHDGSKWGVWAGRLDPNTGWDNPVLLEHTDKSAWNPSVALNNDGRGTVVWARSDDLHQSSIWAIAYEPGTGWSSATRLDSEVIVADEPDPFLNDGFLPENVSSADLPKIAMNDSGNAVAVWVWSNYATTSIWTSRYVPGIGWASAMLVDETASPFCIDVAMDEAGRAVAVSRAGRANLYTPTDGWSIATLHDSNSAARAPNVAMAPNGRALVVWKQEREDLKTDVWSSHFFPPAGWSAPEPIGEADDDAYFVGYSTGSDVTINNSGESFVVWHREQGAWPEEEQPRLSVWTNRFEPGIGWGNATPLAADDIGDALEPRVAMDEQGRAIATWQQLEGEQRSVWSSRFE